MKSKRTQIEYLEDIHHAAAKALVFLENTSEENFVSDDKTVFAVVRALEIIGEATKRVEQDIRDRYPAVPWRAMSGIRDKLIHDYVTVNLDVVWKTVKEDLPVLLLQLASILDEVRAESRNV
jgi:uncharacterized protein with HEPN domain